MGSSTIGSIQIKDIKFSVYADKLENGAFEVYSLWNDSSKNHYQFTYNDGEKAIYTRNFFSVLNKDAYLADDIDIAEMKKTYNEVELENGEETLLNLQALEIIKAYDITHDVQLLEYAKFLLEKIINFDNMHDVARINYLQIKKRLEHLSGEDIKELIQIRNRNEGIFFKISCNILIGNFEEANLQLNSLNVEEIKSFSEFSICKFLNEIKAGDNNKTT